MDKTTAATSNNVQVVGKEMRDLEWQARFVVGKQPHLSAGSREVMLNCLGKIGLAMERYGLESIKDIKEKDIITLFRELDYRGLSDSRKASYASAMRKLCTMMGKDIVPSNAVLGCCNGRGSKNP